MDDDDVGLGTGRKSTAGPSLNWQTERLTDHEQTDRS